jgi:hypothetical protein
MIRILSSYRAGDDVPGWLIDQDPAEKSARQAQITWGIDCHVVEVDGGFFVVPAAGAASGATIRVTGGDHLNIAASSRTVIIPLSFQVIGGRDDGDPAG